MTAKPHASVDITNQWATRLLRSVREVSCTLKGLDIRITGHAKSRRCHTLDNPGRAGSSLIVESLPAMTIWRPAGQP